MQPNPYRVVLLTGAGFSSLVGMKTLSTIIDGIQLPLGDNRPEARLVRDTWAVVKGQKGNSTTLEDLLSRLKHYSEVADLIRNDHIFSEELRANLPHVISGQFKMTWENTLGYCFQIMLDNYGPDKVQIHTAGYELICEVFKMIARHNGGELHLFTTNYDCVPNVFAAHTPDLNFHSHINNRNGTFENKWYITTEASFNKKNPNIYLHRLHGCVGWFFDPRYPYGVHEVYGTGDHLIIEDQNLLNQMAIKLVADEMIGNRPAFSLAFEELRDALEQCEKLVIWGHSFHDREVIRTIINVMDRRGNSPFDIYYIDPYLMEGGAAQNMEDTMRAIPALSPASLKPKRINWVIQDGFENLISHVKNVIDS
jgi:hypothetical protein